MNTKKWIGISLGMIVFLVIIILFIVNILPIHITYDDQSIPSTTYNIQINRRTKKMTVLENHSCSTVDCNNEIIENEITLTNEEFGIIQKILKLEKEKENLVSALSSLAEGEKELYKKGEDYFEEEEDLNHDGLVTSREFGLFYLKSILEENH